MKYNKAKGKLLLVKIERVVSRRYFIPHIRAEYNGEFVVVDLDGNVLELYKIRHKFGQLIVGGNINKACICEVMRSEKMNHGREI